MRYFHHSRKIDRPAGSRHTARGHRRPGLLVEALEDRTLRSMFFAPQNGAETVTDRGGDRLGTGAGNLPLYTIYWGSWWTSTSDGQTLQTQLQNSLNSIYRDSAYLDGLNQYGVLHRAEVLSSGTVEVNDTSDPASGFSRSDIRDVVSNAIDNLGLPEEDDNPNGGLYLVFTPPSIRSDNANANGYHNFMTNNDPSDNDTWHYCWVGDFGGLSTMTATLSHEVSEAMTDPNLDAIKVGTAEICDGEARNYVAFLNGYQVKSYWSEADGAYAIYDGNSQDVNIVNGNLVVNGDQSGFGLQDVVTVDLNDAGGVLVTLDGESFSFSPGQITQVTINSGYGDDTINIRNTTASAPVVVNAGSNNDTINVGSGNPSLLQGAVTVNAESGDDVINISGGSGNDTLVGGPGDDAYFYHTDDVLGSETIDESGGGNDTLNFSGITTRAVAVDLGNAAAQVVNSALTLTLSAGNTIENVIGSALGDTITGNALGNVLIGGPGIDTLDGEDGNDTLVGGAGDDALVGGAGDDTYRFDADIALGRDTINESGGGDDTLDFSDTTTRAVAVDLSNPAAQVVNARLILTLSAGDTIENVIGGAMGDTIAGNALNNVLTGGDGNDTLFGRDGNDTLDGEADDDTLVGGANDDTLTGGLGDDMLIGGADNDTYEFDTDNPLDSDTINDPLGGGNDTLDFSSTTTRTVTVDLSNPAAQAVNGRLTLTLLTGNTIENVIGGALDDTIAGNALDNSLQGGGGDDTLFGRDGNDTLEGGAGDDALFGGANDDTYVFNTDNSLGRDRIDEPVGGGDDTLDFSATTTRAVAIDLGNAAAQIVNAGLILNLSAGNTIENVSGGDLGDTITGNALANNLTGNGGDDILVGNAGDDTLTGNGGTDLLIGGVDFDTLDGGGGDDLLIGGPTSYDANAAALQAILDEWASANTYAIRINNLRTGGGLSGGNYLRATGPARTVFDDGFPDNLTGGKALDWFFQGTGDPITDLNTGGTETVN